MIENRRALKGSVSCVLAFGLILAFSILLRTPPPALSAAEGTTDVAPPALASDAGERVPPVSPGSPEPGPSLPDGARGPAGEPDPGRLWWQLAEAPELASGRVITVCRSGACDFAVIQEAVDAADPGDEIRVAAGVYTDVNDYAGLAQVVYLSKTLSLRGGYTTTNWTAPDAQANPTTLDARGLGRVLYVTGDVSPTVEGLRITGGDAAGLRGGFSLAEHAGGGIYVDGGQALLRGNVVLRNRAEGGGGLYLSESRARVSGNTIVSNTARFGGGLIVSQGVAFIDENTIEHNGATRYGGGLYVRHSSAEVRENRLVGNTAAQGGGGLCLNEANGVLDGNYVADNATGGCGGGLYLYASEASVARNWVGSNRATGTFGGGGVCVSAGSPRLGENWITANRADRDGGGVALYGSDALLVNTMLVDNAAGGLGSGAYVSGGSPALLHTTMARNGATAAAATETTALPPDGVSIDSLTDPNPAETPVSGRGAGLYVRQGSVDMVNTILVGHAVGVYAAGGGSVALDSTLLGEGGWANGVDWAGDGTVEHQNTYVGAPRFVDPGSRDYHIGTDSDAVDRGVDAGVYVDIDGHPRPIGAGFDLGADESTGIDLSRSRKAARPMDVDVGGITTYTLVLANSGHRMAADVVLYDPLPTSTTYVTGSALATQGSIGYGDGVTWTGNLLPANPVTLTYRVIVTQPGPIRNTAVITDEYGTVTQLSALVNAFRAYLPLISRSP